MVTLNDYESGYANQWCPGCGNFGILAAMKNAFVSQKIPPEELLIVSGIGQAAKTPHFLKCNMFHALHGRALHGSQVEYGSRARKRARLIAAFAFLWQPAQLPLRLRE